MVAAATIRAHGQTTADAIAEEKSKEITEVVSLDAERHIDLTRAFQRMRTDWNSVDRQTIDSVRSVVDQQIFDTFSDAYTIMYRIYDIVREKIVDHNTGEVAVGVDGLPKWKRTSDGSYIEDWSKLGYKEREQFLYMIVTRMFEWEQSAADIWGEALFAKAQWEEAFATGFDSISDSKATVDARSARANKLAADHRYLAVYKSMYSKRAEALVRSLDRLCQRIKDLHTSS